MNVFFHEQAQIELDEIASSYFAINPTLGLRFLEEYRLIYSQLKSQPYTCAKMETYRGKCAIRRSMFASFPYVLIFEIKSETQIEIVAVHHASRQPNYWRKRVE